MRPPAARSSATAAKTRFGEIVTDSTKVKTGSVFVALKGERHDGHRFVGDAVRRGAGCVIVHRSLPKSALGRATAIKVADTLTALGDLAHYRRATVWPRRCWRSRVPMAKRRLRKWSRRFSKKLCSAVKRRRGKILKTEGNFNNLVGLPLTLLRLRKQDKMAVVELGTNQPGEIQRLAEIADPDIAIITSVAAAHLEGLNSLAGVAREKGALYRDVRPNGTIVVNLDDPWVRKIAERFPGRKITYGKRGWVRAQAWRMRGMDGMQLKLKAGQHRCDVRLNYLGQHNIANALGAAALTLGVGAKLAAVRRGLAKAQPFSMRMQSEEWRGVRIINDAYNANPASMKAALQTLAELPCRGRRIAVLGDMFELGKQAAREHRRLGKDAARSAIDCLYLLGDRAALVRQRRFGSGHESRADHHWQGSRRPCRAFTRAGEKAAIGYCSKARAA